MNPRLAPRLAAMLLGLTALAAARADAPAKVFAHPDRVRYDGQCLTIDGKDILIFSGTFHYFRCPRELWRDRFRAIKQAGCNAVETYVPWNWHERNPPASPDDYSQVDLRDFKEWLRMAQDEFGFYTIIRPGPYICAEWDGGGFPRWLLARMPADAKVPSGGTLDLDAAAGPGAGGGTASRGRVWLRSDDPQFLAWSEHWLKAVCPVIAPEQVTRRAAGRGGVILVQIENEYDLYREVPEAERIPHLKALYETAVGSGIEVPLFTCWTRQCRDSSDPELSQVFDAFNAYPGTKIESTADRIHNLQSSQPDAPVMISELQGGWFAHVGGALSEDQPGLTAAQLNAHTLLALQEGATILNYYVLVGGTNFGLWPGRQNIASYDYDAPIREPGGVGDKYLAVKALGSMLSRFGDSLVRSELLSCQAETGSPEVVVAVRRGRDGTLYFFFRNRSVTEPQKGDATVWLEGGGEMRIAYDLGPFGSRVLVLPVGGTDPRSGEWWPKAACGPARPSALPQPVRIASAQVRDDEGAADWVPVGPGQMLPELGVYDARPVEYEARLELSAGQLADTDVLRLAPYPGGGPADPADRLAVEVNGHVLRVTSGQSAAAGPWLRAGENRLRVLYEQAGQANFGRTIQDEAGLRGGVLTTPGGEVAIAHWRLARRLGGTLAGWQALGPAPAAGWTSVALDTERPVPRKGGLAEAPQGVTDSLAKWYRAAFELPERDPAVWIPWRALVAAAGDGEIWLNGHALGRYFEDGPQREFYLPECWLRFGRGRPNILTLCLSPMGKGVALRQIEVAPYADQAEIR